MSSVAFDRQQSGPAGQPVALLVDDEPFNLALLQVLIETLGYRAVTARNGAEAVERFAQGGADVVLMDVLMPVMDGFEATRRIKQLSGDEHIPVIFVTSLTDEDQLAACVAAGGDDFISKPVNLTLLQARIRAAERVRDLQRSAERRRAELIHEQELARHVFANVVDGGNEPVAGLALFAHSAERFNGDVVLTGTGPDGSVTLLVGDFTGHGLAAALGALPVTQVFRSMVAKGFSLANLVHALNYQLVKTLPTGRFLAAVLLRLTADGRTCSIYNAGLPDALVLDEKGCLRERISASQPPLGIRATSLEQPPRWLNLHAGDWLMITTDGVAEAPDAAGVHFGYGRLEEVLQAGPPADAIERVKRAVHDHCGEAEQQDDLTVVALPALARTRSPETAATTPVRPAKTPADAWRWLLELGPVALRSTDVVPTLVSQVRDLYGGQELPASLFTVLTELYSNALDHGVLGLQSQIKNSPEGFARYFREREARLAALDRGLVRVTLEALDDGNLRIEVQDSGTGFDHAAALHQSEADALGGADRYCGRGIALVRSLCLDLQYYGCGNHVVAIFPWSSPAGAAGD